MSRIAAIAEFGQQIWLDNLTRDLLASGELARWIAEDAIAGVTYLDGPMGTQWVNPGDTVHWSTPANRIRGDFAGQHIYAIGRARGWW